MPLLSACSDNNFKVIGHIPGAEGSAVLKYSDMEGGFCQDSTGVKNGVFEFKGNVDDVYNAQVFVRQEGKPGLVSFFILEPGKIMVDMKPDADAVPDDSGYAACKAEVSGTKNNLFYNELNEATATAQSRGEMMDAMLNCIRNHKDCEYAAFLYGIYFSNLPLDEFAGEFESFTEPVKNSGFTKRIREDIEYRRLTAPGNEAPEFVLKDVDGNEVSLSSLRGKYVVIDFWASWCRPCRMGMPAMKELYGKFHDKGLEIIAVSQDSDRQKWLDAVRDDGTAWINVIDETEADEYTMKVGSAYGVRAIPAYFLLDTDGRFVGKFDHDGLEEQLSALL